MDDYKQRAADAERWEQRQAEGRRKGEKSLQRAVIVGVALGALGFFLAGFGVGSVMFVAGVFATTWVEAQGD